LAVIIFSKLRRDHRSVEAEAVARLKALQPRDPAIEAVALDLAKRVRATPPGPLSAESFLRHYGLSTREGVALMCVAEALLRIPDAATQDALLREKLALGQWSSASATDWALLLTGKLMQWHDDPSTLKSVIARLGEPVVRAAVRQAMRILAEQFVLAETIEEAVKRGAARAPYVHSYDMLGEAARTEADAEHYMKLYARAIRSVRAPDTLSIKLSALHPRFEGLKRTRVLNELLPRLRELAHLASSRGVGFTIDAEESERLELTLELHEALAQEFPAGLAVQAYQKRALSVCE
jgi:RHH-type proline utilization regulon transcriptional repressor/proline dehydrogenase/delta 1-pyrroline-5-carboxylate dehydrogenase